MREGLLMSYVLNVQHITLLTEQTLVPAHVDALELMKIRVETTQNYGMRYQILSV